MYSDLVSPMKIINSSQRKQQTFWSKSKRSYPEINREVWRFVQSRALRRKPLQSYTDMERREIVLSVGLTVKIKRSNGEIKQCIFVYESNNIYIYIYIYIHNTLYLQVVFMMHRLLVLIQVSPLYQWSGMRLEKSKERRY